MLLLYNESHTRFHTRRKGGAKRSSDPSSTLKKTGLLCINYITVVCSDAPIVNVCNHPSPLLHLQKLPNTDGCVILPSVTSSSMVPLTWEKHHGISMPTGVEEEEEKRQQWGRGHVYTVHNTRTPLYCVNCVVSLYYDCNRAHAPAQVVCSTSIYIQHSQQASVLRPLSPSPIWPIWLPSHAPKRGLCPAWLAFWLTTVQNLRTGA